MLITTCTHCLARFRVTPEQLNAKQGQVRCGRCRKVFSGFEALERYPDDDTGSRLLAAREAQLRETLPDATPSVALEDVEAVEAAEAPPPVPAPPAPERSPAPAPPVAKPSGTKPRFRGPMVYEVERPPVRARARAWAYGAALLALVLAVELAYGSRGALAQQYPVLRPWLESICGAFRCAVPWPNNDALLKLEDSELLEVPGKPNQIALGARIRNLAPHAQEYPHLELTLTDFTGQAAARRVIRPSEYLGRPVASGEVLGATGEFAIQLRLETRSLKATGYELMLFYP